MNGARWYFEEAPESGAVIIRLHWGQDGLPAATLQPPSEFFQLKEIAAFAKAPMDVPSAFAAGVLLSLREKIHLRITGDRSAWSSDWGTLEDISVKRRH